MDFMTMVQEYIIPITAVTAFLIGALMKKWIEDKNDKYIPTFCAVIGVLFNFWVYREITPTIFVQGLASGLAATGMHQAVKQIRDNKDIKITDADDLK